MHCLRHGGICFLLIALLGLFTMMLDAKADAITATTYYVAPGGDDAHPGDAERPFASMERARDAIRALKQESGLPEGGVSVLVRGGEYPVSQTLTLTAEDSGTAESPVVYRAAEGESPVFRGGIRLTGFSPVEDPAVLARLPEEAHGKVLQADAGAQGLGELGPLQLGGFSSGSGFKTYPVVELFFNGEALQMARYPNEGVLRVADICEPDGHTIHGLTGSKIGRIIYDGDRPIRWKDETDAMLYGYWFFDWADSYERILSIDTEKREITFPEPYHNYGYRKDARYYAINLLSEIDMPGEWHLDRQSRIVYLYPPSAPEEAVSELSVFEPLMLSLDQVSHVRFEGLTWELGCADAIQIKGGDQCTIAGCTVRRFGGNAITINGGKEHTILSCDIYSMGRGGIGVSGGDRKTLEPGKHNIENNHIYDLSRIDHTYTPAVWMSGVGNRIAHNLMHHINSSAIRLGGNDHLVEFNEVHDVLLESDDQGGADMWGDATFRGNVYRFNYWHHLGNWHGQDEELPCGQAGIRLDDAISGVLIYGNVFYRCASGKLGFGGVQIHGGKDNIIDNNIFADCTYAISCSPWGDKRWKEFVGEAMNSPQIDAVLYTGRYPDLARLLEDADVNQVRRNLVWNCEHFLHRDRGKTLLEENVISSDESLFPKAAQGNFSTDRIPEDLKEAGFKAIPFEKIGLYPDNYRKCIPKEDIVKARSRSS